MKRTRTERITEDLVMLLLGFLVGMLYVVILELQEDADAKRAAASVAWRK